MNTVSTDIGAYYADCASGSEASYALPERQNEMAILRQRITDILQGQHVLELACGSGYWTAQLAPTVASIIATDLRSEVIVEAAKKNLPTDKVQFALADAYDLPEDLPA